MSSGGGAPSSYMPSSKYAQVPTRMPSSSTNSRRRRIGNRSGGNDDPIFRWLLLLCIIFGIVDIYIYLSMHYRLEQQQRQHIEGGKSSDWRPKDIKSYAAVAPGNKDIVGTAKAAQQQAPPPANQVPSVLPPMDLGNDESQRIKMTLRRAGVSVDDALEARLPTWLEMTSMYGAQPVIIGLDRCETFRNNLAKPSDAMIGPAGMFNSGTNFLEQMLYLNCKIPDSTIESNGMRRNVPWGKHTPASWRGKFEAEVDGGVSHIDTLPVVMIKDPFSWMQSMCRHPYSASWRHTKKHCPNLVDEAAGIHGQGADHAVQVAVRHRKENVTHHNSLAELWNDWYGAYYDAPWPRLIVRYEDLLFYPEFIVTKGCQCAGGKIMYENFNFMTQPVKGGIAHAGTSGMAEAVLRYGKAENRVADFTNKDKAYAVTHLRKDLMATFNYTYPRYMHL